MKSYVFTHGVTIAGIFIPLCKSRFLSGIIFFFLPEWLSLTFLIMLVCQQQIYLALCMSQQLFILTSFLKHIFARYRLIILPPLLLSRCSFTVFSLALFPVRNLMSYLWHTYTFSSVIFYLPLEFSLCITQGSLEKQNQ